MNLKIYQTGPLDVNTYVLTDEKSKEAILIDVGGSFQTIKKELDKYGFKIKFVLNTHGHFDHVLGEIEIQENFPQIPICIHKDDTSHFSRLEQELQMWGFNTNTPALKPSLYIDENTELLLGSQKINILYTPGHSKGSLSYYIDGKLFSGDTLFYRSIGRTDFYDGNYNELINSIKDNLLTLPENTIVFPGHGPSTNIKDEKSLNPYLTT